MSAKRKPNPAQDDLFGGPEDIPPDPFAASTPPPRPGNPYAEGDAARDAGIEQALEGQDDFETEGLRRISRIYRGWEGIAEVWRIPMAFDGWKPRSPNAWGALSKAAERAGLIMDTGRMEKPRDRKSHSRATKVWRRL